MRSWKTLGLCILLAMNVLGAYALPEAFSLEGRTVLIAPASSDFKPATAKASPSGSGFTAILTPEEASQPYVMVIEGVAPEQEFSININGAPLEIAPVFGENNQWFSIQENRLVAGTNHVEVRTADGKPVPATSLLAFSIDFAEEEHLPKLVAPKASPPTIDNNQLQYDVQHMDIAVTLNPASASIPAGVVTLTAKSLVAGLTECVLDFHQSGGNMSVTAVDSGPATPGLAHEWIGARLSIDLPAPVAQNSNFTVRVTYSGTPATGRGLRRSTHSGAPVIFTYNQTYDARFWFPCKDLPEDKFTMEMHATVPTVSYNSYPFSVVSNGTLVSTVPSGGNTTYNWKEDHPIMTQYVSLAASNYRVASGTYEALDGVTEMPVAHHVYPESYAAESGEVDNTIDVMEWMAETFGEYPFLDEKYVTATWAVGGGLEHQTCTSMPTNNLNQPFHRRNIHELAHMWFGVCIGNHTFDHVWLSEGWASYVEILWYDHRPDTKYGSEYDLDFFRATSSDAYPIVSSNGDALSQGVVYRKAAWVLHMLRRVVGDTVFFQATRDYLADPALRYKTSVTSDFQNHVEQEAGEDMDWFFDQWLYRASRPSYQYVWTARHDGTNWWVDLTVNQTQVDTHYVMPIDFRVTFANATNTIVTVENTQRTQAFSINVGAIQPTQLTFDPNDWLLYGTATNMNGAAPALPVLQSVVGNGTAGTATITWTPSTSSFVLGYRVYQSNDGINGWTEVLDESTLGNGATSAVISGLVKDDNRYYRVTAVGGAESGPTDVYGTRIGGSSGLVLVVDGYDRWNSQSGGSNQNFVARYGRAIAAHTNPFDSCANEAVGGSIALGNYGVVAWMCGDESTADDTFSAAEQNLVGNYLEAGGKLFVSGNEIGWDLGRVGISSASDVNFYSNYLKAAFVADNAIDYDVTGSGACFGSNAFSFGIGDAAYIPGWPDAIAPANGSSSALIYNVTHGAGVEYKGTFGSGTEPGGVVYVSFAFETLSSEAQRIQMMDDVLNYFDIQAPVTISGFAIE